MKHYLAIFLLFLSFSCTTTQLSKVISPTGNWDYAITGTPEGDFRGVLSITSDQKKYSGKLSVSGNEVVINNFNWDEKNQKISGDFFYTTYQVYLDAAMLGDELTGSVSAEGMSFPLKATRKK